MKIYFILFISACLIGCSKTPEKPKIDSSTVIISAEIIGYEDLKYASSKEFEYGFYCYPSNWRDGIEFKKEESFFVKAKLDNVLLAALSETDGFEISELLNSNFHRLYGKYLNRWEFEDSIGNIICETKKFEGQNLLDLKRNNNIDEVIIGPLNAKPKRMIIKILDSKYYKENPNPTFDLK